MARVFLMLLLAAGLTKAQEQKPKPAPEVAEPEEEEAVAKPKDYILNPLQAEEEIKIGRYYMKKGSWRAAANRFDEATKWNPGSGEAYLLLGEVREKLRDAKGARAAYAKFLEVAPESKQAPEVKKRLQKLGGGKS